MQPSRFPGIDEQLDELVAQNQDNRASRVQPTTSRYPAIDQHLGEMQRSERLAVENTLDLALPRNPDKAAEAQTLADRFRLDMQTVQAKQDELARIARGEDIRKALVSSPILRRQMTDMKFAEIAHDDVETLSGIESVMTGIKPVKRSFLGGITEPVQRGLAQGRRGLTLLFNELGVFDGLQRQRDAARAASGMAPEGNADLAVRLANQQRQVERFPVPGGIARGMREISNADTFGDAFWAALSNPRAVGEVTLQSLGASAPGLVASAVGSTAGPLGTAAGAGLGSFAVEYGNTLQDVMTERGVNGRDPMALSAALNNPEIMGAAREKAIKRGVPIAMFDALTAGLAGKMLAGAKPTVFSAGSRTAGELGLQAGGGAAGEAVAQGLTGEFKPGDILLEALAELPTAFIEVPANYSNALERAAAAEQHAAALGQLGELAKASKALARSPQSVAQFVQEAAKEQGAENVYVDAKVLNQLAQETGAVLPDPLRDQLAEATARGGDVVIPVGTFTTEIAATDIGQALADHVKLDPNGMSRAEAVEFMQTQGEQLQQEVERTLTEQQSNTEFQASREAVQAQIQQELDALGRFTPEKNAADAVLFASYYATRAAQLGVTPQALFDQRRVRFAAQQLNGESDYLQGEPFTPTEQAMQRWRESLARTPANSSTATAKLQTPAVMRAMGVKTGNIEASPTMLQQVMRKHPDVPLSVFENLPALLSDPDMVFRHREGGLSVVLSARTAKGEPIVVGVRDGRVRTVTPYNDTEKGTGQDRVLAQWEAALQQDTKVYARNKKAPVGTGASAIGGYRANSVDRGSKSPASVLTRDRLVNSLGEDFYQPARGAFSPESFTITLLKGADLSTSLHEGAHFFFENDIALAAELVREQVNPETQNEGALQILADVSALMNWHGITGTIEEQLATWYGMDFEQKRTAHERVAESFEAYLFDGNAPSVEMAPYFQRFREWMLSVYKSIKDFLTRNPEAGKLDDTVRGVFDRMLATREQIEIAQSARSMMPLFNSPEQAGFTVPEFQAYQEMARQSSDAAVDEMEARALRDMAYSRNARGRELKRLQREADELRSEVRIEARSRVMSQPVYQAWTHITATLEGDQKGTNKLFLNPADPTITPEQVELLKARRMVSKAGMPPDVAVDMIPGINTQFANGEQLVRALTKAPDIKEAIEELTDRMMLEQHGELATPEAIERAADLAVHNEVRARLVASELNAIQRMAGKPKILATAAKDYAAKMVNRLMLASVKPHLYAAAKAKAARASEKAFKTGDLEAAAVEKRNELINAYAAVAAKDALAEARATVKYFNSLTKGTDKKTVQRGMDPDVLNAARFILGAYGVGERSAQRAADYLDVLRKNNPELFKVLEPSIQATLANARPLEQLTIEQLRGLREEIEAMAHLAKRSRMMEVGGNLLDREEVVAELDAKLEEIGVPEVIPGEKSAITPMEKAKSSLQYAGAILRRVEQWAEAKDGAFGGPFLRYVFQPVKDAADRYRADRSKYRKAYLDLVQGIAPSMKGGLIEAPELGYTFGKGHNGVAMAELLHAILHTGNASNKRKLLLGRGWAVDMGEGQMDTGRWDAFVERMHREGILRKEHYDFAQGVWDLLESMKPAAQKTHRDVFGMYFQEITAEEFNTPFGTYRGGYVPAQADPQIVKDASLRELAEQENQSMAYSFPTTSKGFTKARVEYNRPLKLDLRSLSQHIDKVLLFTHMEPAVRDVGRVLKDKTIKEKLPRVDPSAIDGMLTPWLKRSASQQVETPVSGDGGLSRVLSTIRTRAGMALMFGNVSNTIQQITGLPGAANKVRPGLLAKATASYMAGPKAMAENVAQSSVYMKERMANEVAAIHNQMSEILLDPSYLEKAQAWTMKHAYFLQSAMDNVIGPIVWTGAYNQAIQQGMADTDAVRFADGVVRQTQGSTLPEDISRIEGGGPVTGNPFVRLFTQFIGYFNMLANTNATELNKVMREVGIKKGATKALGIVFFGLLAPAWIAEAIAIAMRGGPEDDDDDGYLDDWLMQVAGLGSVKFALAGVPFVGQFANAGINRWNGNPVDDRVSLSPGMSLLEGSVGAPYSVYQAMVNDGKASKAVKDVGTAVSLMTGLPAHWAARPIGYMTGIAEDRIEPEGPLDVLRGLVTGTASPESRQ